MATTLDEQIKGLVSRLTPAQLSLLLDDLPDPVVKALSTYVPKGARPRWADPLALGRDLDPRLLATPALEYISAELVRTFNTPDGRLIISMPPQEGKSQLTSRRFPEWILSQNPDLSIAVASYELGVARRWGRTIRDDLTLNPKMGLAVRPDMSAQHEWQLQDHEGGVYSVGIGGALTGRAINGALIIDDPIKDRIQADSKIYRDRVWDWWTDVASTRLAPGTPVVLILTRWHHDDLAGRLMAAEDSGLWRVINIPAQAEEDDPLGRPPGQYLQSARGRTDQQWEAIKVRVGPRTWNALYQGNPSPNEGGLFPTEWTTYQHPMWIQEHDGTCVLTGVDEVAQSWDFTFKDESTSDFVVGQVWARRGAQMFLVDQVRARMDITASLQAIKDLTARWPQATAKFIEDKANGPAIINLLQRQIPGLIPVEPMGSKFSRAAAIAPLVHSGSVILPDSMILPSVSHLLEEARVFPRGKNDDTIDAMSQAVNLMLLNPLVDDDTTEEMIPEGDPHQYLVF